MPVKTKPDARRRPAALTSDNRVRVLAGLPVRERRLELAGVSTAVLEGGEGQPLVLLHEPGSFVGEWLRVLPQLASEHRVIAPDLPGHGASCVGHGELNADRILAWLGELIDRTCQRPPVLVGHLGCGAIALRFVGESQQRLSGLALVDSFGLGGFRPTPGFALALFRYVARPTPRSYDGLMSRCTFDYESMREGIGERWGPYAEYVLDRARSSPGKAALRVIMRELAVPAISPADLARVGVPTSLIWGRHDPVNRLPIAEAASERYGWPLHVIEEAGDDPPMEQPEAFLCALDASIAAAEESGR